MFLLFRLIFVIVVKTFLLSDNCNSDAVVRNNTERACALFIQIPQMVTSCKTIVQYYYQNIDIDTVKTENLS